jgi:hypothetical protein
VDVDRASFCPWIKQNIHIRVYAYFTLPSFISVSSDEGTE